MEAFVLFNIITAALAITALWILSSASIISSIWAIVLSAIVTVLGVVIGLLPLIFLPKKSGAPLNTIQIPNGTSNIQGITAIRHSKVTEAEQTIEMRDGTSNQTINASDESEISRSTQNIKLT